MPVLKLILSFGEGECLVKKYAVYKSETGYYYNEYHDTLDSLKGTKFENIIPLEDMMLPGDVNVDGEVNIADVNATIDVILGGGNGNTMTADVNGDGEINIADVNALINLILSH